MFIPEALRWEQLGPLQLTYQLLNVEDQEGEEPNYEVHMSMGQNKDEQFKKSFDELKKNNVKREASHTHWKDALYFTGESHSFMQSLQNFNLPIHGKVEKKMKECALEGDWL